MCQLGQRGNVYQFLKEFWTEDVLEFGIDRGNTVANLIMAPARENNTCVQSECGLFDSISCRHLLLEKNDECTIYYPDIHLVKCEEQGHIAHQLFQIFAILPIQASIRLPHPVPARSMLPARCKEDNGIIRFNYVKSNQDRIRSAVIVECID